jgi:hypothetical protein
MCNSSVRKCLGTASVSPRNPSMSDELSARERLAVLAVAIFGIGTFFLPLITTATPIFGRTRWSLFDIASRISAGDLPVSPRAADPVDIYLGLA